MLSTYLTRTANLLDDSQNAFWPQSRLTLFINEARGRIAAEGQCVKVLPPGTNGIASIAVSAGGSGYTSTPTVTITGPGSGATATATLVAQVVTAITVTAAGTGYDNTTTVTISGGGGSGATATPTINCWNTVNGQEVYTFAAANVFAQLTAGVDSILFVESVAVSWGALKPILQQWNWNDLQAFVRSYPVVSGQPAMWAQFGQGQGGSAYIRPVPTAAAAMDWNCVCTPLALSTNTDTEAIPYPWTDAVPYYAAYLALMNSRRPEEARNMLSIYKEQMLWSRSQSESTYVPNYYDV